MPDLAKSLWLVVVRDNAYTTEKLEYNICCAETPVQAAELCVDKQRDLHLITPLTPEVMTEVFHDVACCITPLEA